MFKDHKRNLNLLLLQLRHTVRDPEKIHYLDSSHNMQLIIKVTLSIDRQIVHIQEMMNNKDNIDKGESLRYHMQVKLSLTEYKSHLSSQEVPEYQALKANLGITILVGHLPFHF